MPDRSSIVLSRRNRRLDQQRRRAGRLRSAGMGFGIILSLVLAVGILLGALAYADLTRDLPNVAMLPALLNPPDGLLLQPSRIYDRSGEHLLMAFSPAADTSAGDGSQPALRRYIPLPTASPQHFPSFLPKATVVLADPGFWSHGGYRLSGLNDPEAHPTIAQKLVSDLLLYGEQPSLRRALRERILAAQLTAEYGRNQVLEWYLNSADYGNYAYGADAAAELYFGISATELTPAECAILAAASQAPGLNPLDASDMALERGRTAIQLMRDFGLISAEEAKQAVATRVAFAGRQHPELPSVFASLALRQLESQFTRERIVRGGLVITTTMDYELQQAVSCATRAEGCAAASNAAMQKPAAGLVLDPQTGQVLAADGSGAAFLAEHEAGSLLAPFVYLTAFTRGFGPGSLVWDIPAADEAALSMASYHGPARMRVTLANDYAGAAARVSAEMGVAAVGKTEASFGIRSPKMSLVDVAAAYGVFAANGARYGLPGPSTVLRVEGADHRLWLDASNPQAQPVVAPALAYLINSVLSDESARWPSLGHPNELEIGRPVGVKLGRSGDGADTWAIGYTPSRVVALWMDTAPTTGDEPSSAGGAVPADRRVPLLASLLKAATGALPPDGWTAPPDVTSVVVCDPSGLLPTTDCPTTVSEVFLSGNEPVQPDTLFRRYSVNRETGLLATVFTPPELVTEKVFMAIPPEAQEWAKAAGIDAAPAAYDAIQAPPVDPDVRIEAPAIFSEVRGQVKFRGTASGADFDHYRLLVGKGLNPQSWLLVTESSLRVEDGVLGTWDTSGLSGLYAVELQVIRTDQRIDTAIMQVTVK